MYTLHVVSDAEYDVHTGEGILSCSPVLIKERAAFDRLFIIADKKVYDLWKEEADSLFSSFGVPFSFYFIRDAEKDKNMETFSKIMTEMAGQGLTRSSAAASFGGGVSTDMAGFAASVYMRGIKLLHFPTSLVAMTDSAFGGKNAIDHAGIKNVIGTFWQPSCVICDTRLLSTMDRDEYLSGMGEVIKYDMISGEDISLTEELPLMVHRCLSVKERYVNGDVYDTGKRHLLNFGHTFGHAIESLSGYSLSHGRCVGYGMKLITAAAVQEGLCPENVYRDLTDKLDSCGITGMPSFDPEEALKLVSRDKKASSGNVDMVIPCGKGDLRIVSVSLERAGELLREGLSWM